MRLWDVATHRPGGSLPTGPTTPVSSVAFSPNGATLAAGSAHGAWWWGLPSPCNCPIAPAGTSPPARLSGPAGPGNSVAFSPDSSKILAAGSADGTVRLWDMATGRQITALAGPAGPVDSVAFSPDGTTLAASSADHAVRLWDVAYLGNPIPRLCASAGRSLTRAEWAQYVPVLAYQKACP